MDPDEETTKVQPSEEPVEKDAVFYRRLHTSVQNLVPYIIFSNDELHIILKRVNLEICRHSRFFNY